MTTDPVCGMTVDPAKAVGHADHGGTTHYFCSVNCLGKFRTDPARYASHAHDTAVAPAGTDYTCPMHPEILRDAPGDCPKCGMALVPVAGTGEADDAELRNLTRHLWIGVALSLPLVVLAMAPMAGFHDAFGLAPRLRGWLELALGTPVVLWVGWPILRKFWLSLL